MSFLGSLFLWALPLAAIPVVIHLLHRRRRQVVRWGAMQLLLESAPRKRRIWQVNDLLLMILRALAVAAIVLAFARPQLRSGLLTGQAPGRDVILVVDASLSTGRLHGGVPVFDRIRQTACESLDQLKSTDHVRLMLAASAPHWLSEKSRTGSAARTEITQQLAALKPTLAAADMPACVQSALLSEATTDATSRVVIVVTDGAAHGWSAEAAPRWQAVHEIASHAAIPSSIRIVTVDRTKSAFANLSVEKLTTNRTRVAVGESFAVTARVRNTGDTNREATSLKWEIDGQPSGESPVVALEPGQSSDVTYELSYDQPGAFLLTGRLGRDDDLPGDNSTSIVVESLHRLPILVCRSDAELERPPSQPDFLKAALGRGPEGSHGDSVSVFEPTFIGIDALADSDLTQYRGIVFDDVLPKSAELVDRLFDYTSKGGGVWLMLGEHVTPDQFNAVLFRDGNGLVPLTMSQRIKAGDDRGSFFTVHPPDGTHPATVLLGDTERLDIDDVRIKQFWQLAIPESADGVATLLETGDGVPLAVEHFSGDGRIIVMGLPTETTWSNLAISQVFVPLVHEWVWYLTQPTATNYNLDPGAPIVLASQIVGKQTKAQVHTPLGETASLAIDRAAGSELRDRATLFPGNYLVTLAATDAPGLRIPFAVRRDPEESVVVPLSVEQIAALSKSGGLEFTADVVQLPEQPASSVRYQPFWGYLVGLVALLFLAELVCMQLLSKRRLTS